MRAPYNSDICSLKRLEFKSVLRRLGARAPVVRHGPSPAIASLGLPRAGEGKLPRERERESSGGQGFFYGGDELLEREGLRQEGVLAVLGQVLLERIFRIAGDEDDLQVRIAGA